MRIDRSVDDILRDRFGRREISPAARSVADALLHGRSALLVAPDAPERELPWRIAAAAGRLPVLIVAPSDRGLDRRSEALARGLDLTVCHLQARMTDGALERLAGQLASGGWDAAVLSGRSFADPRLTRAARALAPRLLVIEDAHRLSARGRQLDPAWRQVAQTVRGAPCVLAVSDVADARTREDVIDQLELADCHVALSGLDRPDLRVEARNVPTPPQKDAHLLGLFAEAPDRAVVYTNTGVEAERLAALIRDERGFDALDITNLDAAEFAAALRRFREGGLRVLVTTGALQPGPDWPRISISASVCLPESLELLHRRLSIASGEGARGVLIYERDELPHPDHEEPTWLENVPMMGKPDVGHLLALHAAAVCGERMSYFEISRRSGLHPEEVHTGVAALIHAGAVAPPARGDDWLLAEPGKRLSGEMLEAWARLAGERRQASLRQTQQVIEFALTRRCRRRALAEALDYPLIDGPCHCDRCEPRAPVRISARIPGGYPLRTDDFRGWALALYRRPGEDVPTEGPGRLVERLKYAGDEGCAHRLASLMHRRVRTSRTYRDCDVIVPVPPSAPGTSDSPSQLLAREIGRLSGLPIAEALVSAHQRLPQKELTSLSAKRHNVADAFEITSAELIAGSIVLLVDDIYDSGATMQEAGRALMEAGARDVRMLAAVRTAFGWRRLT
ncbi:MAG: phosphoribosyltransferase family protein [Armatimonadota bacterium]|jgi:ATP-dependent DNA helicase RecQ